MVKASFKRMTHLGEKYPCLRYRASFELVSIVIGADDNVIAASDKNNGYF